MIKKSTLLENLTDLPEEFSIDELVERLIIIQKVDVAQKQSMEGLRFTELEAINMIKKWSK